MKFMIFLISVVLLTLSCERDKIDELNCHPVIEAIKAGEDEQAVHLLNARLELLQPLPISQKDPYGHTKNFEILIQELDKCDGIFITLPCYGCIETFPVTSELRVSWIGLPADSARFIDIRTPADSVMRAVRIH